MDKSKLSEWMSKNAITIVFLGVMFGVTWILLLLADFGIWE